MKRIKPYLLAVLVCVAAGLCFAGKTWAWPTAAVVGRDHLAVGAVDATLRIWQDEQEFSAREPLAPGEYALELTASGDAEGWFLLRLSGPESGTEPKVCRTEVLAPGESVRFQLHLAETAVLAVEGRWDPAAEDLAVFTETDVIFWGQSQTGETEEPTEVPEIEETGGPTEAPETEETEESTEVPETEETEEPTEVPEIEETGESTEVPETEETEEPTEVPETEETEEPTEAPGTEETVQETEAPETETSEPEVTETTA